MMIFEKNGNVKVDNNENEISESIQLLEEKRKSADYRNGSWANNFKYYNNITESPFSRKVSNVVKTRYIDLNAKVDEFINWYTNNMVKKRYTTNGEYRAPIEMRNLIEKVAVWYELRYPDYEVNKLYPGSSLDTVEVNEEMFINNPYMKNMNDASNIVYLDWDEFYNFNAFFNSLPEEEKIYLKPRFHYDIVYILKIGGPHFHLREDGTIYGADDIEFLKSYFKEEDFINLSLKEAIEKMENEGFDIPRDSEIRKVANNIENWEYLIDEFYNCVMYRIIERGGNRIGARRAFMFAKEFNRNIDIPMAYGVDLSDPGLRSFINEYIKAGGREELNCYIGYHSREAKRAKLDIVTIKKLLYTNGYNCFKFYTPEEEDDYQRLVYSLAVYAYKRKKQEEDEAKLRLEEVKRLRIERHLEKSKKRK